MIQRFGVTGSISDEHGSMMMMMILRLRPLGQEYWNLGDLKGRSNPQPAVLIAHKYMHLEDILVITYNYLQLLIITYNYL